ncbi:hypothetical protein Slin14017_G000790 [Septoria linicola]|nr:hypothetical protein Slin14017_G000790 [Septoria linicola]
MERRGKRQIFPHAYQYHFDCDEFVPYEFSSTPTPTPEKPLLAEIATLLQNRDICQLIGIFHAKAPGPPWTEKMLYDGEEGTVATQLPSGGRLSHGDIVTEWVIREGILGAELEAHKGCADTEAGYKRTSDMD